MTDRELYERIKAARVELYVLSVEAGKNSKYHSRTVLAQMSNQLTEIEDTLAWMVGEK